MTQKIVLGSPPISGKAALLQSQVIWSELARMKVNNSNFSLREIKKQTIEICIENEILPVRAKYYLHLCPLCSYYRGVLYSCSDCPWPVYDNSGIEGRCENASKSPYREWFFNPTTENAAKVRDLLFTLL